MRKIIYLIALICTISALVVGCGTKEIKDNELDKQFTINGALDLTESKYYVDKDNIEIQLRYNGDVLRVGIVKQIRNSVEEEFKGKYKSIDLTIKQEDPYDSVNYIFENNKWDKEVE